MKILILISLSLSPVFTITLLEYLRGNINKTLTFADEKYYEFNFDGILGITLAEAYLIRNPGPNADLLEKCRNIRLKVAPLLPITPDYMITFRRKLLDPIAWTLSIPSNYSLGAIKDLGVYENWTKETILRNKKAIYKGHRSDECFREILEESRSGEACYVSRNCEEMMLDGDRIDFGYLMTHRLLYLQIARLQGCLIPKRAYYTAHFCTSIYKEVKTSEYLGYPYHDIFMEQVLLCGMEGFSEFLKPKWLVKVSLWQEGQGCYKSYDQMKSKRSSNVIDYGCSDHTTGLGVALAALFYDYLK